MAYIARQYVVVATRSRRTINPMGRPWGGGGEHPGGMREWGRGGGAFSIKNISMRSNIM